MQQFFLKAADGYTLAATLFPAREDAGKLLVINSATGVKQQLYFSFAEFLSAQGITVLTYDYRGIGQSKPEVLKNFPATMRSWGTLDFPAVTDYINQKFPEHRKFCLGHSVGALILGMNADACSFEKFLFIATQDAYYGNLRPQVAALGLGGFGLALPLLTALRGYFPAHLFGLGESLPSGVAHDWKTLILNPKSTARLYEKVGLALPVTLSQPVTVFFAEDDSWVTKKGMEGLLKNVYPNLKPTFRKLKTVDSPVGKIGHVNFFRKYNRDLWQLMRSELG